jgi:GAF domain-containing protein
VWGRPSIHFPFRWRVASGLGDLQRFSGIQGVCCAESNTPRSSQRCRSRSARTPNDPYSKTNPEYSYGAKDFEAIHTVLGVPILKGDDLLGVIVLNHKEAFRPFTDKQIALVETFADQAAIAIDNVRLLDELRHRTGELGRSVSELQAHVRTQFAVGPDPWGRQ